LCIISVSYVFAPFVISSPANIVSLVKASYLHRAKIKLKIDRSGIDKVVDTSEHSEKRKQGNSIETDQDETKQVHKEPTFRTRKQPASSMYGKKKSMRRIEFDSSQSDDEALSPPAPSPPPVKRRRYTEEELDALKEGYKRFGRQWARIRSSYDILQYRDPVSLKVRNALICFP
jgi:hypothetical protein